MSDKIYVVTMYRWGDQEQHSYVLGTYDSKQKANVAGRAEKTYRGNKYEPSVTEHVLNKTQKELKKELEHRLKDVDMGIEKVKITSEVRSLKTDIELVTSDWVILYLSHGTFEYNPKTGEIISHNK